MSAAPAAVLQVEAPVRVEMRLVVGPAVVTAQAGALVGRTVVAVQAAALVGRAVVTAVVAVQAGAVVAALAARSMVVRPTRAVTCRH